MVDNDPAREFVGTDDQLVRDIGEIKKALTANPVKFPAVPPDPDKKR